jgi:type I restriction enzyme S subunit
MSEKYFTKTLGEVTSFINRGISPKYLTTGGIRVLNQKCIRNHQINYELARRHDVDKKSVAEDKCIRLGDVLVNSTGTGTLGRVAQVISEPSEPTTVDSHITIIMPLKGLFALEYFGYLMISIENGFKSAGEGASGQTELSRRIISEGFSVTYPIDKTEQETIIGKLRTAFEKIEHLHSTCLKESILAKNIYASEVNAIFNSISEKFIKLGSVSKINYGYTAKSSLSLNGPKYLRITDIQDGEVLWNEVPNCEISDDELVKFRLIDGDIVFARTGATTGKSYLIKNAPLSVFASYLIKVAVNQDKFLPEFVYQYFRSSEYWSLISGGISGAAQGGFNASKLSNLTIPLATKDVQKSVINKLEAVDIHTSKLSDIYIQKAKRYTELKESLLNEAFSSNL